MVAILHNIRSLHNVGSIFRTADGAGVKKLYLTGYTPSPVDKFGKKIPQLTKVSLGAEDSVEWEKVSNISFLISHLKRDGYKIYAVEQSPRSIPYNSKGVMTHHNTAKKLVLVFGNEVRGLSKAILKKCDKILEIPMRGKKESLNVSVAFGIVVYGIM
ncbi:MAG: TrmH family RNA methyltransferase [Candidatus Colwellbacteria bacterium]|nr:TrmH family RNA methyltransferase [Candidatus Colwellbacteria bacterium]